MSPEWIRRSLALAVISLTMAVGTAAGAHLPRYVVVRTDAGSLTVRTYGTTVAEAMRDGRIEIRPQDRTVPALSTRLAGGMTIRIRRAVPVLLIVGGQKRWVLTAARTAGQVLSEAGVRVRPRDRVHPALGTVLRPGARLRVVRIETRVVSRAESLPYARITSPDPVLPRGVIHVASAGRPGLQIRRVAVTTADGVVVARKTVDTVTLRPPQDLIIHVGTRPLIASRGEFAGKEFIYVEATGYAPWHGRGVDGTTSTGMKAGYGVVAVDPELIPLRSLLYIDGYGRAIAGDVGSAIKGRRIDLGFNTVREAYRFGRRVVRVYILSSPAAGGP